MPRFLPYLFALITILATSACNTIEGIGRDLEAAGDKMEDTANKHKRY